MAFHPIDRDTDFLLPPSVQQWLPQAHLARYVVNVIEQLDLSAMERRVRHAGKGSDAYHPAMLLALLIYGYATGTFSSRKIERATYARWRFATSPAIGILITTRGPIFASASASSSKRPSCTKIVRTRPGGLRHRLAHGEVRQHPDSSC